MYLEKCTHISHSGWWAFEVAAESIFRFWEPVSCSLDQPVNGHYSQLNCNFRFKFKFYAWKIEHFCIASNRIKPWGSMVTIPWMLSMTHFHYRFAIEMTQKKIQFYLNRCCFSFSADYSAATANIRKCIACTDIERIVAGCSSTTLQWSAKVKRQLFAGCDASVGILCRIDPIRTAVYHHHWTAVHSTGGWQFRSINGYPSGSNDDHSTFLDADNDDVHDPVTVNNATTDHHILMVG